MANNCTPNIQAKLNDLYNVGQATVNAGAVKMALSTENGAQIQAKMINKDGKNSQYSITYASPDCDTPVDCDDFSCSGGGTATSNLTSCLTFNSFDCKSMPAWRKIGIGSLRDLGSLEVVDVFATKLYGQMQKIKDAIDTQVVTEICASASEGQLLKLLQNNAPNFNVDADILADFMDAGYSVNPLLLGNRQVMKFGRSQGASGLNSNGIDLSAMTRFPIFYDKNVVEDNCAPADEGNDVMLAVTPGIVNLVSWSENAGMFATRNVPTTWDAVDPSQLLQMGETFMHTVIQDPESGLLYDLNLIYEPKCKDVLYSLKSYYRLVVLPLQGCKDSNFTGIIKYDICPTGSVSC